MEQYIIEEVTNENIKQVKRFHQGTFAIPFQDNFFNVLLKCLYTRVYKSNDLIIGCVCCSEKIVGCSKVLYIYTLGVHPARRDKGMGTSLMDFAEGKAKDQRVDKIMLHVQTSNVTAINFYKKRGYRISQTVPNYYFRLQPNSAYEMIKNVD